MSACYWMHRLNWSLLHCWKHYFLCSTTSSLLVPFMSSNACCPHALKETNFEGLSSYYFCYSNWWVLPFHPEDSSNYGYCFLSAPAKLSSTAFVAVSEVQAVSVVYFFKVIYLKLVWNYHAPLRTCFWTVISLGQIWTIGKKSKQLNDATYLDVFLVSIWEIDHIEPVINFFTH